MARFDLPQWDGGKYRAELPDGRVVELSGGAGGDVVSSCGEVLTLRDGSKARYIRSAEPAPVTRKEVWDDEMGQWRPA